jgi:cell division FtsZ-interacting protein ZapD
MAAVLHIRARTEGVPITSRRLVAGRLLALDAWRTVIVIRSGIPGGTCGMCVQSLNVHATMPDFVESQLAQVVIIRGLASEPPGSGPNGS